jgi:uncharacterized MAPEG superfamily protein
MSEMISVSMDLRLLAYSALLCLLLWIPYVLAGIQVRGLTTMVGYPTAQYDALPDWAKRTQRAHVNLAENLVPFAALVLAAQVAGVADGTTVLGAQLFFWGRLVHAIVMIAGIPWVRTLSFAVAWIGCLIIFWQIVA